jgi:hypothetical protein
MHWKAEWKLQVRVEHLRQEPHCGEIMEENMESHPHDVWLNKEFLDMQPKPKCIKWNLVKWFRYGCFPKDSCVGSLVSNVMVSRGGRCLRGGASGRWFDCGRTTPKNAGLVGKD